MKIVSMVCPNCGASIQVDADKKNLTCNYCGNNLYLDDEVQHIQYDNAEETGYQFEKGRQRAQIEHMQQFNSNNQKPSKKRKTWLWVLGWICIFPLPLTILLVRKKSMKPVLKYGLIAAAWIIYLLIGLSGAGNDKNTETNNTGTVAVESSTETTSDSGEADENVKPDTVTEETSEDKEITADDMYSLIADFVEEYNSVADNKIINTTNYDIHEEHYRTEYRLQAFNESVGTFGEATDSTFEIIASKPGMFSSGTLTYRNLRIYGSFNDADEAKKALETIIPIIDPSITVEMIQDEYSEYRPDELNTLIKGDSGDFSVYIKHTPSGSTYKFELFID